MLMLHVCWTNIQVPPNICLSFLSLPKYWTSSELTRVIILSTLTLHECNVVDQSVFRRHSKQINCVPYLELAKYSSASEQACLLPKYRIQREQIPLPRLHLGVLAREHLRAGRLQAIIVIQTIHKAVLQLTPTVWWRFPRNKLTVVNCSKFALQ